MQGLKEQHQHLRIEMTEPERILWRKLRGRQMNGLKFRRQAPIGPYIVDFLCHERKLVIEIDGDTHSFRQKHDKIRTQYLESKGYIVYRYHNQDIMTNLDGVMQDINHAPSTLTLPLSHSERE